MTRKNIATFKAPTSPEKCLHCFSTSKIMLTLFCLATGIHLKSFLMWFLGKVWILLWCLWYLLSKWFGIYIVENNSGNGNSGWKKIVNNVFSQDFFYCIPISMKSFLSNWTFECISEGNIGIKRKMFILSLMLFLSY